MRIGVSSSGREEDHMMQCGYCRGTRSPCTCTEDCGARPEESLTGNSHVCGKAPADVRAAWLRSTGFYSEGEIARRTGQDPRP